MKMVFSASETEESLLENVIKVQALGHAVFKPLRATGPVPANAFLTLGTSAIGLFVPGACP